MSAKLASFAPRARTLFDLATTAVAVFAALIAVGALASSLIAGNLPGEPLAPLSKVTLCMNSVATDSAAGADHVHN
ncbi:hypothetical protein BH09PSE6_BH09PSE6_27210 [soil metagenome]